jgi:putative RNA 2'-phosphotransferase
VDRKRIVQVSKYLSLHLRHHPERLGLELEPGGWVPVAVLLAACAADRMPLTPAELSEVVETNDKKRFSFDEDGSHIRANQGHSVAVDLQLEPVTPPEILYHGTATKVLDAILAQGLLKMSRHHVHMTTSTETAMKCGSRHGKPVILQLDAAGLHAAGGVFYCSSNGVWLVEHVPPAYLSILAG